MRKYDLNKMAGGALFQRFNESMEKVAENIADPNTKATATRKVTITLTFKPTEQRDIVSGTVDVKTTLAQPEGSGLAIIVGMDETGKVKSAEIQSNVIDQDQQYIKMDGSLTSAIKELHKKYEED